MNKQRFAVIIVALIGGLVYLYHVYHSDYSGFEKGSA